MLNIEELEKKDNLKTKILKYIMYKKRTEEEVKRKFGNIDDHELLEELIDELKENGYINDNNYIERAIAEFISLKNLSLKELKYKLLSKGLKKNLIDDYFSQKSDELEDYEINSAKNIILKKKNSMEEQDLIQFLLKKGYKIENIKQAIFMLNN